MRMPEYRPVAVERTYTHHIVNHLERWEIGTSYVTVVEESLALCRKLLDLQAKEDLDARDNLQTGESWFDTPPPILGVDHTGVGIAVVDMIRAAPCPVPLIAITITGGESSQGKPQTDDGYRPWTVPKAELVGPVIVATQNKRLNIVPKLKHAPALAQEMAKFRMKLKPTGSVSYEAAQEEDHDDLILAVGIGLWISHRVDLQSIGGAG